MAHTQQAGVETSHTYLQQCVAHLPQALQAEPVQHTHTIPGHMGMVAGNLHLPHRHTCMIGVRTLQAASWDLHGRQRGGQNPTTEPPSAWVSHCIHCPRLGAGRYPPPLQHTTSHPGTAASRWRRESIILRAWLSAERYVMKREERRLKAE